ncbi:tyrosine--tRNA ligase 1, cytoplasmic-like [Oryza glaberrima]|uniref:tyrosine--tRNA ligase 1, cytoplasmic-like n=1 Tax=Oryza glaberrima TaxID=4538 RepID=UPI00224C0321|nr:tyrosine--tRNA ligase 1, cytoplasmic-like [Oryza glaberrima]
MDNLDDVAFDINEDNVVINSDEKFAVLRSIGDECIYEDELRGLLKNKPSPTCCVWFEPSTNMDIEQGIMKTIYVNRMVKAGCAVKIVTADWFLQRHYKIGNNLSKIRNIGYLNIEMWKAAGMDLDRVELVWLSDELNLHAVDYWPVAMDVSRRYTMTRIARIFWSNAEHGPQILPAAEIIYPCMQVASILCEKTNIWLFSMDQRDIIMLTRDYCENINWVNKPTILLHDALPNLLEDPEYVDLRDRGRTIFMHDEEHTLNSKIQRAFCPPKVVVHNPCLEYIKYIILPWFGNLEVVQNEWNGSTKTFVSMEELSVDYERGYLNSADVKMALEKAINNILEPVRDYFSGNTKAQALIMACQLQNEITGDVLKIQMQNKEMRHH